jgi:hypothetical protein
LALTAENLKVMPLLWIESGTMVGPATDWKVGSISGDKIERSKAWLGLMSPISNVDPASYGSTVLKSE